MGSEKVLPMIAAGVYEGVLLVWEAVEAARETVIHLYRYLPDGTQKISQLQSSSISSALCYKVDGGHKTTVKAHYMIDRQHNVRRYRVAYLGLNWDSGWVDVWRRVSIPVWLVKRRVRATPTLHSVPPCFQLHYPLGVSEAWRLDTDVLTLSPNVGSVWTREAVLPANTPGQSSGVLQIPAPKPDRPGDYLYLIVWDRLPRFVSHPDPLPPERASERFSPIDYAIVEWRPLVYSFSEKFVDAGGKTSARISFPREFSPSRGDRYIIEAKTPPGAVWEVAIGIPTPKRPEDENSYHWYRRWRGKGPNLRIVWDGKDTRGKLVPAGEDVIVAVYVNGKEVEGSIIYVE